MKILITGTSKGIGKITALKFLKEGFEVYGIDILDASIDYPNYHHYKADISKKNELPTISGLNYIFANAGKQNSDDDISNNLVGTINTIEKYGFDKDVKAMLINASASARSGQEFPEYVASKSGLIGYMKNVAIRVAPQGVLCNSISLGGVLTESNKPVTDDPKLWKEVMEVTPLKKWMNEDEVAEWVYFLLIKNKSMSGQDLLIDNGEQDLNSTFVWPK